MEGIMQGTTPTLTIAINTEDFLVGNATRIELYIQSGTNCRTYDEQDLQVDTEENTISKVFTEEETAALNRNFKVEVQARFWFADHSVVGINRITFRVADMLGVGN